MPSGSTRHIEPLLPGPAFPAGSSRRRQTFPTNQLARRSRTRPVVPGFAWTYSRSITINHQKVGATNLTNFPVLVGGTLPWLRSVGNGGQVQSASGFDVAFYADPQLTQPLDFEVELYTAATGAVAYWVRIPTVFAAVDTVFYIAYGATVGGTLANPVGVWDANYQGVWHLSTVTGGASSVLDSTKNARHGTPVGSPTNAAGQVDGAGAFASASSQSVTLPTTINPPAVTYSAWVKATSFPNAYNAAIERDNVANTVFSGILITSTGKLALYVVATATVFYDATGTNTLIAGNWYHVVLTYDSAGGLKGYVNGGIDGSAGANGALNTTAVTLSIATDPGLGGRLWNGAIDEARISDTVRSADWILTEYNNQLNPDTFYTFDLMPAERRLNRAPSRRSPAAYSSRRRRTRGSAVAELPLGPPDITNQPRVARAMRSRRVRGGRPIPAQLGTAANADQIQQPHRVRALTTRRATRVEVVPTVTAVVDPSVMWSPPLSRKLRGTARRARRPVEVVPPQFNPPFPFVPVVQPKRNRGILRGKARHREVVPAQDATPLLDVNVQARRLRALRPRRARPIETTPPQFNPPYPFSDLVQPRRPRGLLARRARRFEVTVPQEFLPADTAQPRRPRSLRVRRSRPVEAPITQAAPVTDPSVMWSPRLSPRRTLVRRARRPVETPLTQTAPVADPSVMWSPRLVARRALVRRPRRPVEVIPPQLNPPYPFSPIVQPRRARGLLPRRARRWELVVPQTFPTVEAVQPRRARNLLARRARRTEAPLTQAAPIADASVMWSAPVTARKMRGMARRARRPVETVPAQLNPPYPHAKVGQPRRARALVVRKARVRTETTPARRRFFPKVRWF